MQIQDISSCMKVSFCGGFPHFWCILIVSAIFNKQYRDFRVYKCVHTICNYTKFGQTLIFGQLAIVKVCDLANGDHVSHFCLDMCAAHTKI